MPVTGRALKFLAPKYLIVLGMLLSAAGMWVSEGISLQSSESYFMWMRILHMLGTPFLFVSTLAVAFSDIPVRESSNASAIVSLMKNLGGSFGISLVTSYLEHRQQIEQSYLVSHMTPDHAGYLLGLNGYAEAVRNFHISSLLNDNALTHGILMKVYQELQLQADILAYIDTFRLLGILFLLLALAAFFLPSGNGRAEAK